MPFKRVLVPFDESDHAQGALHVALDLVGDDPEALVSVVEVVSPTALPDPLPPAEAADGAWNAAFLDEYDRLMGARLERMRADLADTVARALDDARCATSAEVVIAGTPVEGIVEYVERHGIDLVVMGRRGLGPLRGMLGSVSFGVLRSVSVPVLTVK